MIFAKYNKQHKINTVGIIDTTYFTVRGEKFKKEVTARHEVRWSRLTESGWSKIFRKSTRDALEAKLESFKKGNFG